MLTHQLSQKMANQYLTITFFSSTLLSCLLVSCIAQRSPKDVENWFTKLPHAKEKVTKLHFYFHDVVRGAHPTSIPVAQGNSTYTSPALFGLVSMIDNRLTAGPGTRSKVVGRAQGITGFSSSSEMGLLMTVNFVFTSGKFNGSTLSVVGYNPITHQYREMAIVGGSGVFRLARGIATAETARLNPRSGNAVVEYSVMVLHY